MRDINQLAARVANHLAGQPVHLRWRTPSAAHAIGQIYRSDHGVMIDVADCQDYSSKYRVFLHECAHVRLGHAAIASSAQDAPPGSIERSQAARDAWCVDPREAQAEALAKSWREYAERHAWRFDEFDQPGIVAHLLALLSWES